MRPLKLCTIFCLLLFTLPLPSFSKAMGNTRVITLEFPSGAENTALGEAGVSLANSPYSVFWNPASIPALYDEYKCRVMYSYFHEELLPELGFGDLFHYDTSFTILLNDLIPEFDLGFSRRTAYLNFGDILV